MRSPYVRWSIRKSVAAGCFLAFLGSAIGASGASAQQSQEASQPAISVEVSPQIFATMCALEAAGFGVDESTFGQMPARLALRTDLLQMQGPATEALRQFYREHTFANPAETLSRYITFALVVGPPPEFQLPTEREMLPPDVSTIEGFPEILANFYREANLGLRWAKIEPEYGPALRGYRTSLARIVTVSNGYLRELTPGAASRTFTVYVEPFVGARTNFRIYSNHYAIVVGPVSDARVDAIQHAYLHFMLDPLVLRNRVAVGKKQALLAIAARAPRLPFEYEDDFVALTDECLIKAVELRLRHLPASDLEAALRDADQSGFILVRPFVAQLQKFEKAEPAMTYYFPDLFAGIDVQAEEKRLQSVTFAAGPAAVADEASGTPEKGEASVVDQLLAAGDREIAQKNPAGAAERFEKVLATDPNNPRALYGLAIASVLSGKAEQARDLFAKLVSAPRDSASDLREPIDPEILSWSHVYLGRIHDLEEERDLAVNEYRAALAVDGAPEAARIAAENGIEAAYKPPVPAKGAEQRP